MRARHNGTATSRAAAMSAAGHARTLRLAVFQALVDAGSFGLTREELSIRTGIEGDSLRPRVCELVDMKLIRHLPEPMTRRTRKGRNATILTAC